MFSVLTLLLFLATASLCFGQPVITNQPQTQAVAPGATVTFDVGARGTAPLTYQWQKNPGNWFFRPREPHQCRPGADQRAAMGRD